MGCWSHGHYKEVLVILDASETTLPLLALMGATRPAGTGEHGDDRDGPAAGSALC